MSIGSLFNEIIVQPIFNLLVAIYALLPGHNFGLAIIIFTIVVRLLMWPLVKKQLHQTKMMRKLQPELKRIKKDANGDRKKEGEMVMELYKERGISPFGSIGTLIVQFIILIGLYLGLKRLVDDPKAIIDNAYGFLRELPWMQTLRGDLGQFDQTLVGLMDLTRPAIDKAGDLYWPALLLVIGSAAAQYFQSVQLLPKAEDSRTLREILRESAQGKQADQSEVSTAVARSTRFFIPAMIFIFTLNLPAALSLYWMVGAIVAYFQQARVLNQDEEELEEIADKGDKAIIEGEVIEKKPAKKTAGAKKTKSAAKKKRRK
jgi:YidC/Oxa1 family membrane protein insertase